MICKPCGKGDHELCPSKKSFEDVPTGLSKEAEKIQRSGLCQCHHRVVIK